MRFRVSPFIEPLSYDEIRKGDRKIGPLYDPPKYLETDFSLRNVILSLNPCARAPTLCHRETLLRGPIHAGREKDLKEEGERGTQQTRVLFRAEESARHPRVSRARK